MKTHIITFILLLFTVLAYSQEIVSSNGGTAKNAEIEISWTIGEPVILTFSNEKNVLTQGFHQSKLTLTPVYEVKQNLQIKVYPNPTTQRVFVDVGAQADLHYELYNAKGKLLEQNTLSVPLNEINIESLANGSYYLKVIRDKNVIGSYKLVKMY